MFVDQNSLKEFLVAARVASRPELDNLQAEAKQNGLSLSERVLAEGLIAGDDLRRLEARVAGVPFISGWPDKIPYKVLARIPEPLARAYNCLALAETGDGLEVIGLDLSQITNLGSILGLTGRLQPCLGPETLVRRLLLDYQSDLRHHFGEPLRRLSAELEGEKSERQLAEIINLLFGQARVSGAQRVHLEVTPKETLVRYRIGGRLYDVLSTNPHIGNRLFEAAGESTVFSPYPYEPLFRHETDLSKRAVFSRRGNVTDLSFSEVGLWGGALDLVEKTLQIGGLTAFATAELANQKELFYTLAAEAVDIGKAVLMIESQRERYLNHVEQVMVGSGSGRSPAELLRRLLPQDFDVLIIDRVDGPETMALAATAAARGLAVFVGIEAVDLPDLVDQSMRLIGDHYILSAVGRGFVYTKPIRRLSPQSRSVALSERELKDLAGFVDMTKVNNALGGVDSPDSISHGRFCVCHPVRTDNPLKIRPTYFIEAIELDRITGELLRDGQSGKEIVKDAFKRGALTMAEDALAKAALGRVDLNEAITLIRRHPSPVAK